MMVARMTHRCYACGEYSVCYFVNGVWSCSGCAATRVVTNKLAGVLETLATIARDGPDAAANLARAFRRGAANAAWGRMLQYMADRIEAGEAGQVIQRTGNDAAAGIWDVRKDETCSLMLDKARSAEITYAFPSLATAYKQGRRRGSALDKACGKRYEAYAKHCRELGYVPPGNRTFKAPSEQRWAVNYLRHECSGYTETYKQLQKEARDVLGPDTLSDELDVVCEKIHQTVKNRVLDKIAACFPDLASAAREQMV